MYFFLCTVSQEPTQCFVLFGSWLTVLRLIAMGHLLNDVDFD
jgi:hypothetical protein